MTASIHDFKVETAAGEERPLGDFRGKALLVVNTASRCGLTPQYEGLTALRERYAARGFEVLAFPANDFSGRSRDPTTRSSSSARRSSGPRSPCSPRSASRARRSHRSIPG
jgi:glutathione peroxidase